MTEDRTPDPRTQKPGICGVTWTGGTGIEWICVRYVHARVYTVKRRDKRGNVTTRVVEPGTRVDGLPPQADRHYMIRRWPNRPSLSPNV